MRGFGATGDGRDALESDPHCRDHRSTPLLFFACMRCPVLTQTQTRRSYAMLRSDTAYVTVCKAMRWCPVLTLRYAPHRSH